MDPERRLELIALLAQDQGWKMMLFIGQEILDAVYPAGIFTGVSGDPGPKYIVALRDALSVLKELP